MEPIELAQQVQSALEHLWRYEAGSAADANAEMAAATLLLERVRDELLGIDQDD